MKCQQKDNRPIYCKEWWGIQNDGLQMMTWKKHDGIWLPRGFCQPVRSIKRARHNTKLKKKNVAQVSMNEITFFMRMCAIYICSRIANEKKKKSAEFMKIINRKIPNISIYKVCNIHVLYINVYNYSSLIFFST